MLKTTSSRLRRFITDSAYLSAELQESKDQMIDRAESNVLEALNDEEDASRRDTMSRFVLGNLGRARGWGTGNAGINIKNSGGTIVVQWADGSTFGAGGGALAGESGPEPIDVTPDEDVDVVGAAG